MSEPSTADFLEQPFPWDCTVPCGAELADPRRRRRSWLPGARVAAAILTALVLHGALLLLWRQERSRTLELVGQDGGAGGIALSLVSARAGGVFAQDTAVADKDLQRERGVKPAPSREQPPTAEPEGANGADAQPESQGHITGGVGDAQAAPSTMASAGSGYDPGAFASLAPLSFSAVSEPGFWEQVKRCFKGEAARDLTLRVVLDEEGTFINAYRAVDSVGAAQSDGEQETFASAIDALKECSPYRDVRRGLSERLVLVVPGQAAVAAAAPSRSLGEPAF